MNNLTRLGGIAASPGISIAKAYKLENPELIIEDQRLEAAEEVEQEILRFEAALKQSTIELEEVKASAQQNVGEETAAIFSAHLLILKDPEFVDTIKNKVKEEQVNAERALQAVANLFISMFEQMENEYMKERAADIRDVSNRLLAHLLGMQITSLTEITEDVVLVAEDLTPSETAQINRQFVQGFITDIGGRTSHSAIMARSMEIPAIVGTKLATKQIEHGDWVILDGIEGLAIIHPSEQELEEYQLKKAQFDRQKSEWAQLVHQPSLTADGHQIELAANIGTPEDMKGVLENGAEGIGLYRTEFLYMGRQQLPTEEEQFQAYKRVLEQMVGKPVVIRTLDIGGDKELPYLQLPKELNPFLGFRAIRLCLEEQSMFRTQLRALLRASHYGQLKIMFPMIATLQEFQQAKAILLEEKEALKKSGVPVSEEIEIGIMVEIPVVAMMAEQFAKYVDFFSIGTNDLIQYTMASDRMNERVSYLYQPFNPAILRLIHKVITAAHQEGKWVGMCGEMAGDTLAIPILLGMGLDEFSISASSVLAARSQVSQLEKSKIEAHIETILNLETEEQVIQYSKEKFLVK
jgi:phosphotransferase system enzyme I (PtsI)